MDDHAKAVVREMTVASDEERIGFPDVVRALAAAGVERYHADLPVGTKTYHAADGSSETVSGRAHGGASEAFSAVGVEAAVRAIQRGEIGYGTFCARLAAAGCVGYHVSIAGRRATYYGRTLDTHVERFPGAGP